MDRSELVQQLVENEFGYWRDDEFHRGVFTNKSAEVKVGSKVLCVSLEVFIDYYTVRIVWYYDGRNKVSKSYYITKEIAETESLESLLSSFVAETSKKYKIEI